MNLVFKNYFNILTLFLPILFVYIPSIFFPINNAGSNIPFRPPPITLAIVWPILLILVGISWYNRTNLTMYYLFLSILLGAWTIFYNYSKISSFIEILITLFLTIFLIIYKFENLSSILLIPLALWLSFASLLNGYDILN